jgi:hypothetical protein
MLLRTGQNQRDLPPINAAQYPQQQRVTDIPGSALKAIAAHR